ncbi:competence type IV pilus minor pilin ComGG [Bacillus sp. DJP31]|uniref:competence type IV pilus minor pilin ComGG n=1 Tax=Bacillus sp. DJP31 TaxID=3409789 RepID=UPI003BB52903
MNNQKGYILPFVLMLSTLLFFILSHQVTMYVTEMKFYQESKELQEIERMIQKSVKDMIVLVQDEAFQNKEILYEEGKVTIQLISESSTQKIITIRVQTINKRKSSVILYYDTVNQRITRWTEGR